MAGHGPLHPLRQLLCRQVVGLAGDVAVAGHVAVTVVLDVAADLLVQRREGRDVGVRPLVDHGDLQDTLKLYAVCCTHYWDICQHYTVKTIRSAY